MKTDHAVIVCGHAVYTAMDFRQPLDDASWFHLPYQKGEAPAHVEHIKVGVNTAAGSPGSILILAGGQSRLEAGPRSEGLSYWLIAEHFGWWGHREVRDRTILEEFSRDSIENLLFGICRFREHQGVLPASVTVVSWEFKRPRFELHRQAIEWPRDGFHFAGPNNPADIETALAGESRILSQFQNAPFGTDDMRARRAQRNPFRRQHGYFTSCPEMVPWLSRLS